MSQFTGKTTPITIHLLIINVLVFLASFVFRNKGFDLNETFALHYYAADNFHWWQAFTYMFLHADFTHLFNNMFSLFMFGRLLEDVWGAKRFIIYYFFAGLGAAIFQQLAWSVSMNDFFVQCLTVANPTVIEEVQHMNFQELMEIPGGRDLVSHLITVGASGGVFGILLAFGMMFPNAVIYLLIPPIPLKAKWMVILYGLFELFCGVASMQPGIAHYAHLGGMVFGFFLILFWRHYHRREF